MLSLPLIKVIPAQMTNRIKLINFNKSNVPVSASCSIFVSGRKKVQKNAVPIRLKNANPIEKILLLRKKKRVLTANAILAI